MAFCIVFVFRGNEIIEGANLIWRCDIPTAVSMGEVFARRKVAVTGQGAGGGRHVD